MEKINALQNFADNFGLTVKHYIFPDARKKVKYILVKNKTSISPPLNYEGINAFLLGMKAAGKIEYIDFKKELLS
jgi:hypothetical protein